jgi:hypothetical protein
VKKSPWSFKIDYDKAIAEDEAYIAKLTTCMEKGWYATQITWSDTDGKTVTSELMDLADLALYVPGVAASIPLSLQDLSDMVAYRTRHSDPDYENQIRTGVEKMLGVTLPPESSCWYQRGEGVVCSLDGFTFLPREAEVKTLLKKAKASLSRHKRNKVKYG